MAGEDPFAALRGAQQKQQQGGGAAEGVTTEKQQPEVGGAAAAESTPQPTEKRPVAPPPVEAPTANGAGGAATATAVRKPRLLSRPEKITGYVSSDMKAVLADLAHKPRANGKYPKGEAEVIAWFLELGRRSWESDGKPPMP